MDIQALHNGQWWDLNPENWRCYHAAFNYLPSVCVIINYNISKRLLNHFFFIVQAMKSNLPPNVPTTQYIIVILLFITLLIQCTPPIY